MGELSRRDSDRVRIQLNRFVLILGESGMHLSGNLGDWMDQRSKDPRYFHSFYVPVPLDSTEFYHTVNVQTHKSGSRLASLPV